MMTLVGAVSGFVIGTLSGLLGIGGGVLLVPLFVFFFKMTMYRAVGTALAVIGIASLVGAFSHHLRGNVDLVPVLWVAVGAALGVFLSGQIIHGIPPMVLKRAFAVLLLIVAGRMFFQG